MIDLHPNEKILLTIRRHWFVFLGEVAALIFATFLPFVIPFFSNLIYDWGTAYLAETQITSIIIFFSAAWLMLLWITFFVIFTNYYLDVLIVTNQRVIDIEQIGLFARDIATAPLGSIQDVKIEILGVIATAFNFGNLHLQTAGGDKEIVIHGIKNPEYVKKLIMSTHQSEVPSHDSARP